MPKPCKLFTGPGRLGKYGQVYSPVTQRTRGAHRVAWEEANDCPIPKEANGRTFDICHTCDTPLCIEPTHLFAAPRKVNIQDSIKKGRWPARDGANGPNAKLTKEEVRAIRADMTSTDKQLAEKYGVTEGTIEHILNYRTWKNV